MKKSQGPGALFILLFFSGWLLSVTFLTGCTPGYSLRQGADFLDLYSQRTSLDTALSRRDLSWRQRLRLLQIKKIRAFGDKHLGLPAGENYKTYVDTDGQPVSWNITATEWNSLSPLTWSFPVVGSFPYIGFLTKSDAETYRDGLLAGGYDVHMRPVPAFSTLGWFEDPVYSYMLQSPEPILAETIFHELFHKHVFYSNNVTLSESAAVVVGRESALLYLKNRHGAESSVVSNTRAYFQDGDRVASFFRGLEDRLTAIYRSDKDPEEMKQRKQEVLRNAKLSFLSFKDELDTGGWGMLVSSDWNNAFVASMSTYQKHGPLLQRLWKVFSPDMKAMVSFLKNLQGSDRPVEEIREFVKKKRGSESTTTRGE